MFPSFSPYLPPLSRSRVLLGLQDCPWLRCLRRVNIQPSVNWKLCEKHGHSLLAFSLSYEIVLIIMVFSVKQVPNCFIVEIRVFSRVARPWPSAVSPPPYRHSPRRLPTCYLVHGDFKAFFLLLLGSKFELGRFVSLSCGRCSCSSSLSLKTSCSLFALMQVQIPLNLFQPLTLSACNSAFREIQS